MATPRMHALLHAAPTTRRASRGQPSNLGELNEWSLRDALRFTKHGQRVIDFFRQADCDGSGELSLEEFGSALRRMGFVTATTEQVRHVFTVCDEDASGSIPYMELDAILRHMPSEAVHDTSILATPKSHRCRAVRTALRRARRAPEPLEPGEGYVPGSARTKTQARVLALEAVRHDGRALRCVDASLRADRFVSHEAVRNHRAALNFAPQLKRDRQLILDLVQRDGLALQHVGPRWQNDREIVLEAVRQNGWAFRFASAARRADRSIVPVAVEAHGRNLIYVSDESLLSDRELMLHCVSRNGMCAQKCRLRCAWHAQTVVDGADRLPPPFSMGATPC
jgi:hypothetical protein